MVPFCYLTSYMWKSRINALSSKDLTLHLNSGESTMKRIWIALIAAGVLPSATYAETQQFRYCPTEQAHTGSWETTPYVLYASVPGEFEFVQVMPRYEFTSSTYQNWCKVEGYSPKGLSVFTFGPAGGGTGTGMLVAR